MFGVSWLWGELFKPYLYGGVGVGAVGSAVLLPPPVALCERLPCPPRLMARLGVCRSAVLLGVFLERCLVDFVGLLVAQIAQVFGCVFVGVCCGSFCVSVIPPI